MDRAAQVVAPPANPSTDYDQQLTFSGTPFQGDWQGVGADYSALPGYGLSAAQLSADLDRVATSGVKIVSTWFDTGWAYTAGYPTGSPDWSSAKMIEFYAYLSGLKARGVKVMIKMGWHFPQNVGAASGTAPITPTPANEATFAAWVSESLHQVINVRGFTNVIGCLFFTEPSSVQVGFIPAPYTAVDYYAHIVTVVRDKIVADDASRIPIRPRVRLTGPSEQNFTNFDWTQYLAANFPTLLDGYAVHSYRNTPGFAPLGIVAVDSYQPWIDFFTTGVGYASPKTLIADEGGFVVGADSDSTGYRATADAGWQWCRLIDGHMQAGCSSSLIWLLGDQPILGDPVTGPVLRYGATGYIKEGTTVKPDWYAISMMANLTGGGGGTGLYRCTGGTSTLHGTGVWVPFGVKNTVNPSGEWSFVVINEGAAIDVKIRVPAAVAGRNLYRYTYSGEYVPPAAANPAYLSPWDRQFLAVGTSLPTDRIPGRSVTIYSTMSIAAPASENLALTATARTDSLGAGLPRYAASGNPSNVTGNGNGWRKADNASHWLELSWPAAVPIGRFELAFVGTTAGVVYATYTDTSTPAPLADYTIEYWNGAAWVQVVSVAANAQPNRTHTITPVTTTKVRIIPTSAAATAQINNFAPYSA